ncbi:MAG: FAD-dependent oxidoreductase [Elusimicrobiota bacterium]|jgi:protoporphyrinogen oxidase
MLEVDVLVVGAGLAGLSTARALRGSGLRTLVVERDDKVGGRAGTVEHEGFLFDHTGHLLHLHDPKASRLILGLLGKNVHSLERSSWIHSQGVDTRYPFQANTYGLPPGTVSECVALFLKSRLRGDRIPREPSFRDWALAAFGEGICRRFMFPYNEKLWRTPLERMTTEWQGRFLPRPSAEEVLYGALRDQKKFFGYNASFRYPLRGGIQALPDAFAAGLEGVHLGAELERVDLRERVARVRGLGEVRYRRLVNTSPLAYFLDRADGLSSSVKEARRRLRWRTVYNLNIGVARPRLSGKHWVYFPEGRFVFYRAGFSSNFSAHMAPKGTSSMYIEISRRPEERVDLPRLERATLEGLRASGLLGRSDRLVARQWNPIDCAYVVYDRSRTPAVRTIMSWLGGRGVESIGRWGGWKYSFMEEAVLDGMRCAERLRGRARGGATEPSPHKELIPIR